MANDDELRYGPPGESEVHICVDMQRMFAEATDWKMPWLPRVLPNTLAVTAAHPERSLFTRFIPAHPLAPVPSSCTKIGLKQAFDELGTWTAVKVVIAANTNVQEEWGSRDRKSPRKSLVQHMIAVVGLSDAQVD